MLTDLTFCEAHWVFACYYFKVANNIPIAIQRGTITTQSMRMFDIMYWTGIVANVVFPIGEGVFGTWLFVE